MTIIVSSIFNLVKHNIVYYIFHISVRYFQSPGASFARFILGLICYNFKNRKGN